MQHIDDVSLLLQRYVRKGNDAKNPAILSFFFATERTQLNAAQLLAKLRPMNELPVIGYPCLREELWDRQGANIASR